MLVYLREDDSDIDFDTENAVPIPNCPEEATYPSEGQRPGKTENRKRFFKL